MYDEMGKPCDGESCCNFEEASEEEMTDGQRLANGDIKVDDCIGFLQGIIEYESPDSMKSKYVNRIVDLLRDYQSIKREKAIWHPIDEKADSSKFVVFYDVNGGYMSPPSRCLLGYDTDFVKAMNKKHGANYTMWAYKDDLAPKKQD
jgi:hypothetical protein